MVFYDELKFNSRIIVHSEADVDVVVSFKSGIDITVNTMEK